MSLSSCPYRYVDRDCGVIYRARQGLEEIYRIGSLGQRPVTDRSQRERQYVGGVESFDIHLQRGEGGVAELAGT
jgi:hypothetical protein